MNFPFCLLRIDIIGYSYVFFNTEVLHFTFKLTIIDTVDKLIETINKVTWKEIKSKATLVTKEYKKGISIDKNDIKTLEKKHVYREEGIEKWSLVITP